jgi:hypothetical protein
MDESVTLAIRNLVLICARVFLIQTILELFASPLVTYEDENGGRHAVRSNE